MTDASTIELPRAPHENAAQERRPCSHCGTLCRDERFRRNEKIFCCAGCRTVFELLTENGLGEFYQLNAVAGVRVTAAAGADHFRFLDEPAVRERLVDFADEKWTRVTFQIPAIHCIACVWLLENLFRLRPGIGQSQVNFVRKEVAIAFHSAEVRLSDVLALLASLGYEPELKLSALEAKPRERAVRRLAIQLGLAGFAFGNIMLFSISTYLGLDTFSGPGFQKMVGMISLCLAIPVVAYSALDYWRAAWTSVRQRVLNIDVPIAVGVAAIFLQSTFEVLSGRGNGYFDSLSGLVFFLLCGRWFQQKTYDRLSFDRDYKAFFPLSITRKSKNGEAAVSIAQLEVGDRLLIRNGELIPADARLVSGPALIDYSFVTGESEPVKKNAGDHLYAGGRQMGGTIEVETVKPVLQSYLTSLWNQEAFRKDKGNTLTTLTNRYSQRFTRLVLGIAIGAGIFWMFAKPAIAVKASTSVLIVACPCALALAAPFALGTAQRMLAGRKVFLKNPGVLETLAKVDAVVFDKTGTLTAAGAGSVVWQGATLTETEERWIYSMARHSTHPLAVRIGEAMGTREVPDSARSFVEISGSGMEGVLAGHEIWMGSAGWLESRGLNIPSCPAPVAGSQVHVAMDGKYRGHFLLTEAVRAESQRLANGLRGRLEVSLLSGDNEKQRNRFKELFSGEANLRFNQSPFDKLQFIQDRQANGRTVLMVGDGLNDAGALKQADVGVAVVENIGAFSPASDVILAAGMVTRLPEILNYAKQSVRVVRAAFVISAIYNAIGVFIAARGWLAPVVCAVLMPLSSVTVVSFACGATSWLGRRLGNERRSEEV